MILPRTFFAFLIYSCRPYQGPLTAIFVLSALAGLYGTLSAYLMKLLIDSLIELKASDSTFLIFKASVGPALGFIVSYQCHEWVWRGAEYINLKTAPRIKNHMIGGVFACLQHYPLGYFQDHHSGTIASNITILSETTEKLLHPVFCLLLTTVIQIMVAFFTMYWVHDVFALALLIWGGAFLTIRYLFAKQAKNYAAAYAHSQSQLIGKIVDACQGMGTARLFSHMNHESLYLSHYLDSIKQSFRNKEWFILLLSFWQGISITALIAFIMFFLIHLRAAQRVTIGDFALILSLVLAITRNMWTLTKQIDLINESIGRINQGLNMLSSPTEYAQLDTPALITAGRIECKNIVFEYIPDQPVFYEQSITIPGGQKVGLVGYSGAGKSTFVNLILRLFALKSGAIYIDNQEISTVTLSSLRQQIAIIPQDPVLFHRSILENIRYGCLEASDEEVIAAAKKAQAHDFIAALPQAYETLVGDRGVKLSAGQRQRLSIARALLKKARILILDEATSQLDSISEQAVQAALWELMDNKTTLVIAHRLSTLIKMDRILVFHRGQIIEDGTHEALLAQAGMYKQLWDTQVGGFVRAEQSLNVEN